MLNNQGWDASIDKQLCGFVWPYGLKIAGVIAILSRHRVKSYYKFSNLFQTFWLSMTET